MARFTEKTVVVTGGGGGIGGATCRRFAAEGAKVAVFDLNLEAAQKVAGDIRAGGGVAGGRWAMPKRRAMVQPRRISSALAAEVAS